MRRLLLGSAAAGCEGGMIGEARQKQLDRVDEMPPQLRACVHEFGAAIVVACLAAGVTSPRKIQLLVKEIWAGARQPAQSTSAHDTLDWLLIQTQANISAATLRRILAENSLAIVSAEPTRKMLNASMYEVTPACGLLKKEEKHRRRLRAAIRAAMPPTVGAA